jgi:hypothetical protein
MSRYYIGTALDTAKQPARTSAFDENLANEQIKDKKASKSTKCYPLHSQSDIPGNMQRLKPMPMPSPPLLRHGRKKKKRGFSPGGGNDREKKNRGWEQHAEYCSCIVAAGSRHTPRLANIWVLGHCDRFSPVRFGDTNMHLRTPQTLETL